MSRRFIYLSGVILVIVLAYVVIARPFEAALPVVSKIEFQGDEACPDLVAVAGNGQVYTLSSYVDGFHLRVYGKDGAIDWTKDIAASSMHSEILLNNTPGGISAYQSLQSPYTFTNGILLMDIKNDRQVSKQELRLDKKYSIGNVLLKDKDFYVVGGVETNTTDFPSIIKFGPDGQKRMHLNVQSFVKLLMIDTAISLSPEISVALREYVSRSAHLMAARFGRKACRSVIVAALYGLALIRMNQYQA